MFNKKFGWHLVFEITRILLLVMIIYEVLFIFQQNARIRTKGSRQIQTRVKTRSRKAILKDCLIENLVDDEEW